MRVAGLEFVRWRVRWSGWRGLAFLAALAAGPAVQGLIFYSTGDPGYNTRPPKGALADSGWKWVGEWAGFQGTVIGPHQFIAARHTGGRIGDPFFLHGVRFTTSAYSDDGEADLRIWMVRGSFRSWAPLHRAQDEVGKGVVVIAGGVGRGAAVEVNGALCGWRWGGGAGRLRWGRNSVASIVEGGTGWGDLLFSLFSPSEGPNGADLAGGDSGGPVFVRGTKRWELAGVALGVEGPFSATAAGDGFNAAIFDGRGLYLLDRYRRWQLISGLKAVPSGFYATRISTRAAWIDSVLSQPYRPVSPVLLPRPGRPQ
jgi:hypothetical protein